MINTLDTSLPCSDRLNISALSRIFNKSTTSYKFLFFLSLLDILARRNFDASDPISFDDITVEVLANAWFPHTFFKLSFGTQDTIAKKLDSLILDIDESIFKFRDHDKKSLRKAISSTNLGDANRLMDFVPYRLISSFLEDELRNVDKGKWMVFESKMPAITNHYFNIKNPLYKFDSDSYKECKHIYFNKLWVQYLKDNFSIIHAWASWNWLQYMQKRNPSTPSLSNKLYMPTRRQSLTKPVTM